MEKYSSDYNVCLEQAREQMNNDVRLELSEYDKNLEMYDVTFPGYAGGIIGLN